MLILTEFLCILDFMLILVDVHYEFFLNVNNLLIKKYSHPNISLKSNISYLLSHGKFEIINHFLFVNKSQSFGDIKITSLTFNNIIPSIIKQSTKFKNRKVY